MPAMTIRNIIATTDLPELPEADRKRLQERIAAAIERDLMNVLSGGLPLGYEPGKGPPGTIRPRSYGCPECGGTILHRANCKLACVT